MNLIVITGFLGSGKTTFLTKLAKRATEKGLKVGILVNEIGEIGIDDQFMRRLGLNVWEVLGGCICCTLTTDLIATLETLKRDFQADVVLVEPSGAADPRAVISTLDRFDKGSVTGKRQIALVDMLRMEMLMEVLSPLTTATIQSADLILLNKTDVSSSEQVEYAVAAARNVSPEASIQVVSVKNDLAPSLWEELDRWMQ
ncbi:MAG: cobalamin biosynthesis protein CobW [Deltaproteobacteria bacterium]|nr:cobalamin biosynthesis protein CobW [Deltaproteobacteria bacterium]